MDNELLIAAIDAAEQTAYSSEGDTQLASDRAYAIDMYLGKNLEPAPEGRSQVIDRSVYETIQWILPSLCRIFANGDDVVELPPEGPEDEEAAKQESQYLNYIIQRKNNWFETFITWAKDALLTKNGYCLVYDEERTRLEVDEYQRQTEQGVALLMADKEVEVEVLAQYPDEDAQLQPVIDPMTQQPALDPMGQPLMQPPPMLYDVKVTRRTPEKKLCIKVLPPERCKVSYRTPSFRLNDECPYFEYYDYKTLSDLKSSGFKLPKEIPDDWQIDEEEDLARDQYDETSWREDGNEPDPSQRRYKVRMIWINHDEDEDGIAERLYVVRIGRHILHRKHCSRINVASLVADPNGHRHIANSIADITVDIQRIKTAILRQGLDNLYLANNPRTFITERVNLDDALISRPGGIVRGDAGAVFGQDIAPLVTPFVFPQAMEGLEYMDQVRENRTGTNRYFTGIDQNAMNKTATGIKQLSSMAAQRVEQIARIMACGIEDLFSIVHELVLKSGHKREVVKLSNKWVEVDPSQWKKRTDFRISVGYAAGNKDALSAKLLMLANMQKEAMLGGLPIVTAENIYETAIELTKASDFSAPNRFWTNPKDAPPKPPPQPDPSVVAAEQMKLQGKELEVSQRERESEREAMLERYRVDTDAQVKLTIANAQIESSHALEGKRAETEDKKLGVSIHQAQLKSETDRNKAVDAKKVGELDQVTGELMQQAQAVGAVLQNIMNKLQSINSVVSAKKRVVKGKDGRAAAIEMVGEDGAVLGSQRIVRGKDGSIEGTA